MSRVSLYQEYYSWLCHLVCGDNYGKSLEYKKLLTRLNDIDFTYILEMDVNRALNAVSFRDRFAYEKGYDTNYVVEYFEDAPASVLEVLVTLAFTCEEKIMRDPDYGDRTGLWFWSMIDNLGLSDMKNDAFDVDIVDSVVSTFLEREYEPDGRGGLFTLKHCKYDLRNIDIWYQMMWWLNENFDFSV